MPNYIDTMRGGNVDYGIYSKVLADNIANEYDPQKTYAVGDYCFNDTVLYRCNMAITTAEAWNGAHWTAVDVTDEISDLKSALNYSNDQLGSYKYGLINKSYEKRFTGLFKVGNVLNYFDRYEPSSRAFFKIEDAFIDGDVYIFNPKKYIIGVYYRQKSDNLYIGYAISNSMKPFIKFTPDTSTYDYWLMGVHQTNGSESLWNSDDLEDANRNIHIYSGEYINYCDDLSLRFSPNIITPDKIHIGKYYYGAANLANNPKMAYTDLLPIKENHVYYFTYLTLGYSWYAEDGVTVLGGNYAAVEAVSQRPAYITLTAPAGAAFIGVSVRSGDIPNMVLSELADSKAHVEQISSLPVAKSRVVREPLNWLYNMDFKQNMAGSRIRQGNNVEFDGDKAILSTAGSLFCSDQICMDKSKIDVIFSVPNNGSPEFVVGYNGYDAQTSLSISDGAVAVVFLSNGTSAEIRMGTGENGNYQTLLKTVDISTLNIHSGRHIAISIEKDTINRWVISILDALTPNNVITEVIEATQNQQNENLYSGQIRGWGGPYIKSVSGNVYVHKLQMYSTAPTYPHVAIWGDSYVENMGRNPACSYAYLLRDALDGNALLSGQGGATAMQTSYRLAKEINSCAPQYIILNVGVNDSFGVSVDTYKTALLRLIDMVKEKGSVPILITTPNVPAGNSTTRAFCEAANPWVRSLGYDYIDIAYALSTGDGITGDASKFVSDRTHPNLEGGQAIFNYIKVHNPYLLWK